MGSRASFDFAIVGAGIVGLACALAATDRGRRVVVIDRDERANGASVRNFGFVTVTGQAEGEMWRRARRSREVWEHVAPVASIAILQRGLLMVARRPESAAVLEAFAATEMGEACRLLTPGELRRRQPEITGADMTAALWSPHELRVESRNAIPLLAAWLEARGVVFRRQTAALAVETGKVFTSQGMIETQAIAVCPGDDLVTLFAEHIATHGLERCKLQMLRLADPGFRLASPVMSDLGLIRYAGYAALPEVAALRERLMAEQPDHVAHGVHLIVVQGEDGELVVGDSHHYAATPDPFASEAVDKLILEELSAVFGRPPPAVTQRWTGTYAYGPSPVLLETPLPGVRLVMVTTGAGASTAFALGEEVIDELMAEGEA